MEDQPLQMKNISHQKWSNPTFNLILPAQSSQDLETMSLKPHPFSTEPRFNPWKTIPLNQPWREIAWRFFYHKTCLQDHLPSQRPSSLLGPFLGGRESEKIFKNLYKNLFGSTVILSWTSGMRFFFACFRDLRLRLRWTNSTTKAMFTRPKQPANVQEKTLMEETTWSIYFCMEKSDEPMDIEISNVGLVLVF